MGGRKGGGIFSPVKTTQERVLDTIISILHKGAKTEDMGEESALGRPLRVMFGYSSEGFLWSPGVVEADAGRNSKFLPGARTRAWWLFVAWCVPWWPCRTTAV